MTASHTAIDASPLALRRALRRRLIPLALLMVVAVSSAAPLSSFVLGARDLRDSGAGIAHDLAAALGRDAARRPSLWHYDSLKILEHVRRYEVQAGVSQILVLDRSNLPIDARGFSENGEAAEPLTDQAVVWERAPIRVGGESIGQVWVAMGLSSVTREALWLAVPWGLLGLLLAALFVGISLSSAGRGEQRIRRLVGRLQASREELAGLNRNLEEQVEARVEELSDAVSEIRSLSTRAVIFQEEERRAIGRDLHDSAGQALTAVRIHLKLIADGTEPQQRVRELAETAIEITDSALDEVRRATARLGPAVVDEIGLVAALKRLALDTSEQSRLDAHFDAGGEWSDLPPAVETACYRIAQAALTNVLRHADATEVRLDIKREDDAVYLEVEDDGLGLDRSDSPWPSGRGLKGMRERAELLGGRLELDASPLGGARVFVSIPIDPLAKASEGHLS